MNRLFCGARPKRLKCQCRNSLYGFGSSLLYIAEVKSENVGVKLCFSQEHESKNRKMRFTDQSEVPTKNETVHAFAA